MNSDSFNRTQILFWAFAIEGGLILSALSLGWLCSVPVWDLVKFNWLALVRGVLLTAPMVGCFFLFVRWPIGPLRGIKRFVDDVVRPMFAACSLADLVLISLLAGIGEELFFRAFLQPLFGQWFEPWTGIILAAIVFGLAHFITPTYALLAAAAGLYFGVAVHLWGNVLDTVIAHSLYDFVGLVWLVRLDNSSGESQPDVIPISDDLI